MDAWRQVYHSTYVQPIASWDLEVKKLNILVIESCPNVMNELGIVLWNQEKQWVIGLHRIFDLYITAHRQNVSLHNVASTKRLLNKTSP